MITLDQVKAELDVTSGTYEELIEGLIEAVIAVWEQSTRKKWQEQTVKETFYSVEGGAVYLTGENVSLIYSVASGLETALVISGDDEDLIPTVTIDDTTLTLITVDGETELTFADYPTLDDLSTQINTVSDWSSTVGFGLNNMRSKFLAETAGNFCESTGTDFYAPDEFVSSAKFDKKSRQLTIPTNYFLPISVIYKCGYTSTDCPAWLRQILIRQVCLWYHQAIEKRWNVSSITLGDGGTISYGEQRGNLLSDFVNAVKSHARVLV